MIILYFSHAFLKEVKRIPFIQQKKLDLLLEILSIDPYSPSLHTKLLKGYSSNVYSFRITRDWRVVFEFIDQNEIKLLNVGHRKDIYR